MYEQINESVGLDYEQIRRSKFWAAGIGSEEPRISISYKDGDSDEFFGEDALDIKKWLKDFSDYMSQFKRKAP